ncbi:esterase/lipase family protein [Altericroceibacterium xinjiangense]|uniref:esterase/lipase family protein n=1 Tax=Altericroceibacterium xinjiangense TaxID=762261 RepID=UPI000F7EF1F1|nr:alpha/beta fold hydrolase [Altericroceibacterium xinjiangense]
MTQGNFLQGAMRRAALVCRKPPQGVKGPPLRHRLGELDVFIQLFRKQEIMVEPARRPGVVMLLPGFFTHPGRMRGMARALEQAGHTVHDWGLGWNFGPTEENFDVLSLRVEALHRKHGRKLVLVGWSLGGVFAREMAKLHPHAVEKVVTMGSPFSGDPHANNAWRLYHLVTGHSVEEPPVTCNVPQKPPVETVALWSPRDGIVAPDASCGREGERDRAVALHCTHLGFAYSPESIWTVLREVNLD